MLKRMDIYFVFVIHLDHVVKISLFNQCKKFFFVNNFFYMRHKYQSTTYIIERERERVAPSLPSATLHGNSMGEEEHGWPSPE